MQRNTMFSEYPRFFVFYNEKQVKGHPAAEGGGGAIKFSAEIMVNRATWQAVECTCFFLEKNRISVAPRRFFRFLHENQ